MGRFRIPRKLLVAAILAGVIVAWVSLAYRGDLRRAMQQVSQGSALVTTRCGPIEYSVDGEGPPILVVHGAGGGFDQGLLFGQDLATRGYRVIAMSRFGYLRTPMPADASAEAQADAHACLLDTLGVQRAAVVGVSAGGPSAMQFAIRHPDRASALVLLVPLAWHPQLKRIGAPPAAMRLALRALEHDFAYWALMRSAPRVVTRTLLASPPELLASASSSERERVAAVRERILPVSARVSGLQADGSVGATIQPYPLERIRAPTLVFSLQDDLFDTYPGAKYTAAHIRGARFVGFPSGGHVWIGHNEEIAAAMTDFLREVAQVRTSAYGLSKAGASTSAEASEEPKRADQ